MDVMKANRGTVPKGREPLLSDNTPCVRHRGEVAPGGGEFKGRSNRQCP